MLKYLRDLKKEAERQREEFLKNGTPITLEFVDERTKISKEEIERKQEEAKIARRQKYKSMRQEEKNWKRKTIVEYNK